MTLNEIKTIVEIVQGIISTIAIIIAGIWSYFIFVLGRGHAINVKLELIPQYQFQSGDSSFIVMRVLVENIGRTKAGKEGCYIALEEISISETSKLPTRSDKSFNLNNSKVFSVFENHQYLEPSEKLHEDIIISFNPNKLFKVAAYWCEKKVAWSSIHIISPSNISENIINKE